MIQSGIMKRLWIMSFVVALVLLVASPARANEQGELLDRVNTLRAGVGVHPYTMNGALTAAAQNHADWMVATGIYSHTQSDGSSPVTRARAAGYPSRWVSENYYMGQMASVGVAMDFWINSPVHYRGMTNNQYYEIGIASARGNGLTAYVLVFGNPNTSRSVAPPASNPAGGEASSGASSAAASGGAPPPPSFIIGRDEWGNYLHEVQAGQTLGEVVLMYGYGWADLQMFRDINSLTEAEGRRLAIGDLVKVPPADGTWTPAPGTPSPTPFVPATETPIPQEPTITPTITPTDSAPYQFPTLTPMVLLPDPTETPQPTATHTASVTATPPQWAANTMTPSPTEPDAVAVVATESPEVVVARRSPEESAELSSGGAADSSSGGGLPVWLIVAVVAQVVVLLVASLEYMRRRPNPH